VVPSNFVSSKRLIAMSLYTLAHTLRQNAPHLQNRSRKAGKNSKILPFLREGVVCQFKGDSEKETPLHHFIHSIILSTLLRHFFRLAITAANIEDIIWIVGNTSQAENVWKDTFEIPSN